MKYLSFIVLLFVQPVFAETIVSPKEFERLSTGKTLHFSQDGAYYGTEQFFKGRRSRWRYSDGFCENGEWFTQGDLICFNYEGNPETQCWHFLKTDKGYAARAEGAPEGEVLDLDFIDTKPLICRQNDLAV